VSLPGFRSALAVLSTGFEATGPVMGAIGAQIIRPTGCRGLAPRRDLAPLVFPDYENAVRSAWSAVIDRLESDARTTGAHGVVGVGVRRNESVGLSSKNPTVRAGQVLLQLQLIGTGVRVPGIPQLERPFLSTLTMDETLKLLGRGWVPAGIVVGFAAVHVHSWASSPFMRRTLLSNAEMEAPTAGMALARARAEHGARASLARSSASGMVAAKVEIERSSQVCSGGGQQGMLIEGTILGTGVVRYSKPTVGVSAVRNLTGATP
jgi:uncharacterized protein YbjQ (UPF0145 family)